MKNKKAIQLAISTLILLILGVVVLIGLIAMLVMGWEDFKTQIGAVLGSEISQAKKVCKIQCELDNNYDYCCEEKQAGRCSDEILKTDCEIDCFAVSC